MTTEISAQQVFDKVLTHLRAQGVPSLDDEGNCAYRGEDGRMCAAGCLLDDGVLDTSMENSHFRALVDDGAIPKHIADHVDLIMGLQSAHDTALNGYGMAVWESRMSEIAAKLSLDYKAKP